MDLRGADGGPARVFVPQASGVPRLRTRTGTFDPAGGERTPLYIACGKWTRRSLDSGCAGKFSVRLVPPPARVVCSVLGAAQVVPPVGMLHLHRSCAPASRGGGWRNRLSLRSARLDGKGAPSAAAWTQWMFIGAAAVDGEFVHEVVFL